MAHFKSTIPSGNHPFMTWLANFLLQINGFMTGGNAPDGEPYFYNRARLRWNNIIVPAITALQAQWTPVSTHGTHTGAQITAFNNAKKLFLKNLLRPFNKEFVLYNSAFTVTNRGNIGILPVVSTLRTAAGMTVEQLFASWKSLGACVYEFHCKTVIDAHRAACPDGKIVQFGYLIANRVAVGAVQPAPPTNILECPMQGVSSHALFTYDFGAANAGKIAYVFFRWFDLHHPEKSGPWSALVTINLA